MAKKEDTGTDVCPVAVLHRVRLRFGLAVHARCTWRRRIRSRPSQLSDLNPQRWREATNGQHLEGWLPCIITACRWFHLPFIPGRTNYVKFTGHCDRPFGAILLQVCSSYKCSFKSMAFWSSGCIRDCNASQCLHMASTLRRSSSFSLYGIFRTDCPLVICTLLSDIT